MVAGPSLFCANETQLIRVSLIGSMTGEVCVFSHQGHISDLLKLFKLRLKDTLCLYEGKNSVNLDSEHFSSF